MHAEPPERLAPAAIGAVAAVATALLVHRASVAVALAVWPVAVAIQLVVGGVETRVVTDAIGERPSDLDAATIRDRVADVAAAVGAPSPSVRLAGTDTPVALVGHLWSAELVVSDGLLERLDGEELDAVLAHELGHLRSRTLLKLALARTVADVAGLAAFWTLVVAPLAPRTRVLVLWFYAGLWLGAVFGHPLSRVLYLVASGGVPLAVLPAVRALARREEFRADSAAAAAVDPAALVRGLSQVETAADGYAVTDGVTGVRVEHVPDADRGWVTALFSEHPPFEARRRRLLGPDRPGGD